MMGYGYIRQLAEEAAEEAEEQGLEPTSIIGLDLSSVPPFPFPFLGDYVPAGWERCADIDGNEVALFCDSSGWGADNEPALSVAQLIDRLEQYQKSGDNYGFAIVESGQFQVTLGVYKPDSRDFTRSGKMRADELNRLGRR